MKKFSMIVSAGFLAAVSIGAHAAEGCRSDASLSCKSAEGVDEAVHLCLYPSNVELEFNGQTHVYEGIEYLKTDDVKTVAYTAPGFGLRVNTGVEANEHGYTGDFSASDLARANFPLRCQPL